MVPVKKRIKPFNDAIALLMTLLMTISYDIFYLNFQLLNSLYCENDFG